MARYSRASRSTVAGSSGLARSRSTSLSAMKILSGSFSTVLRHRPNSASSTSSASFQLRRGARQLGVVLALRMIDEQILPDVEAAGQVRLAVRIQAQPRGQQQHVGIGAEHRTRRAGTGDAAANGRVEALQPLRIGEVILHRTVDARQRVVIAGQPAVVAGPAVFRRTPRPCRGLAPARSPQAFSARAPPGTTALPSRISNMPSEEIEDVRVDLQARRPESASRSASAVSGSSFESPRYRRHSDGSEMK